MIELYTLDPRIRKLATEMCAGVCELEVHSNVKRVDVMRMPFDFVLTPGQLNPGVERFAAQFGAMVAVLPEAGFYLVTKGKAGFVSAVGADYRDVKW
jgi:hypothetical protein